MGCYEKNIESKSNEIKTQDSNKTATIDIVD